MKNRSLSRGTIASICSGFISLIAAAAFSADGDAPTKIDVTPQAMPNAASPVLPAASNLSAAELSKLGFKWRDGLGVSKDFKKSMEYFQKAAALGDSMSATSIGSMYENGQGVSRDYKQAAVWYQKGARLGSPSAERLLGFLYLNGMGVAKNDKTAVSWFLKAANHGYAGAQRDMGYMCESGRGVVKDPKAAVNWYQKANANGFTAAQKDLERLGVVASSTTVTTSSSVVSASNATVSSSSASSTSSTKSSSSLIDAVAAALKKEPAPTDLSSLPDEDSIPFTKNNHGKLLVKGELNGRSIDMIFDTGANGCSVGENHLAIAGIDASKLSGRPMTIGGSSGKTVEMKVVPMTLKLGKTSRNVEVWIQKFSPAEPLVGVNFVAGFQYEINNQLQIIRIKKTPSVAATSAPEKYDPRDRNAVPFTMLGRNIVVEPEICGRKVSMIFDTGADGIAFPMRIWQQLKLPAKFLSRGGSMGIDGIVPAYTYEVERIDFGPVSLKDVKVRVADPGPALPLLGQSVLGGEKFVIDTTKNVIRFHR